MGDEREYCGAVLHRGNSGTTFYTAAHFDSFIAATGRADVVKGYWVADPRTAPEMSKLIERLV